MILRDFFNLLNSDAIMPHKMLLVERKGNLEGMLVWLFCEMMNDAAANSISFNIDGGTKSVQQAIDGD